MSKLIDTFSPHHLHGLPGDSKKINPIDVQTSAEYRAGQVAGA